MTWVRFFGYPSIIDSQLFPSAHKRPEGLRSGVFDSHPKALTWLFLKHVDANFHYVWVTVHLEDPSVLQLVFMFKIFSKNYVWDTENHLVSE